jgi:hypothetical protein
MACNGSGQVAAAYKALWERAKSTAAHKAKGWAKRRYKGLDKAPRLSAMTVGLSHRRDWALGKEGTVSIATLQGRIRCRYEGWSRHPGWLEHPLNHGITLGAAKLWQDHRAKAWYLLVGLERALGSKAMVGLEGPKDIRHRSEHGHSKRAWVKRRQAKRKLSSWSFAGMQAKTAYKTRLSGGVAIWVDADYTGQGCPICGHSGRENRTHKGLLLACAGCGHTLHADLLAARNIGMPTLLVRQDWARTERLSAAPKASGDEAKSARLQGNAQLHWSLDASSAL